MKFWFVIALAISFLGIAVFGVFTMGHGEHSGCVAATANGVPCPTESNAFASAIFHLDAFKNFSTASIVDLAARVLLFVFALLCGLYAHTRFRRNVSSKQVYFSPSFNERPYAIEGQLRHWLALRENSPNAL